MRACPACRFAGRAVRRRGDLDHLFRGTIPQLLRLLALCAGCGAVRKGNIWGLPVNLVLFSLVAGVTTIAAYHVYNEVLLHPTRFRRNSIAGSWRCWRRSPLRWRRSASNVVANFVSPAFDFFERVSQAHRFQEGRLYRGADCARAVSLCTLEGSAASFVGLIGATMGPIFGIMMVDYYLIAKGKVNVPALYQEDGEYRYQNGWNASALVAAGIGALFSSILPTSRRSCQPGGLSMAGSRRRELQVRSITPCGLRCRARW